MEKETLGALEDAVKIVVKSLLGNRAKKRKVANIKKKMGFEDLVDRAEVFSMRITLVVLSAA